MRADNPSQITGSQEMEGEGRGGRGGTRNQEGDCLQKQYCTWSSANVTKAKARNGLGMKTSVTSPYCRKNCLRSSVVMSSVQRPTNTLRLLRGSSGPVCTQTGLILQVVVRGCLSPVHAGMSGHYHTHLWVRDLAVTPSSINHVTLRDHFFLSFIFREPHKTKSFGDPTLITFDLEDKQMTFIRCGIQKRQFSVCFLM